MVTVIFLERWLINLIKLKYMIDLRLGDCLEVMKTIEDNSIDCVVTDPPYSDITGGKNNCKNLKRPKWILNENK